MLQMRRAISVKLVYNSTRSWQIAFSSKLFIANRQQYSTRTRFRCETNNTSATRCDISDVLH